MGEARKRKTSDNGKHVDNGNEAVQPQKSGGVGIISVVLISAILAGSGCHVIKKDTALEIKELTSFVNDLKAKNVATADQMAKLQSTLTAKDKLIDSLKTKVSASEAQAKETDKKMSDLKAEMGRIEKVSVDRNQEIVTLESKLAQTKKELDEKIVAMNTIIDTLPEDIKGNLAWQGAEIAAFVEKLSALDSRVSEQSGLLDEYVNTMGDSTADADIQQLRETFEEAIEAIKADLLDAQSKIPTKHFLEKIKTKADKANENIDAASTRIEAHDKAIKELESVGATELSALGKDVGGLKDVQGKHEAKLVKLGDENKAIQREIDALSDDIDNVKRLQGEKAKPSKAG